MTFTNLNPGTSKLRVKGSNNDGVWNNEGTSLKNVILPSWWQAWWAYTLYILAGISSIIGYIRWRTYSLRKRQKELEKTGTERTAEVVAKNKLIQKEKERSEELLLNILPSETAEELNDTVRIKPKATKW